MKFKCFICLSVLFLTVLVVLHCNAESEEESIDYGPSISRLTGVFLNWRGPDLLALESTKKLRLDAFPTLSVVLPLVTNSDTATSQQIFQERGISTQGEFTVVAPRDHGIVAVIQELKLRLNDKKGSRSAKNATASSTTTAPQPSEADETATYPGTNVCGDYVQFSEPPQVENPLMMRRTGPICGRVKRSRTKAPQLIGPRSFKTESNTMKVIFNHAYVAELVASLLTTKNKPFFLKLSIAFTAFKLDSTCDNADSSEDFQTWRHCNSLCVHSSVFCDQVLNCNDFSDELLTCSQNGTSNSTSFFDRSDEKDEDSEENVDETEMYLRYNSNSVNYYDRTSDLVYPSSSRLPPRYTTVNPLFSSRNFRTNYRRTTTTTTVEPVVMETNEISHSYSNEKMGANSYNSMVSENPNGMLAHPVSRELSSLLHTLVYGVSVFILFLVCATVIGVCAGKKCYVTWCKYRQSQSRPSSRRVRSVNNNFTPTVVVVTNGNSNSNSNTNASFVEESPPSYDSLYPVTV